MKDTADNLWHMPGHPPRVNPLGGVGADGWGGGGTDARNWG